ncbi:MAG: hypothetical protein H0T50_15180 [Gemmatimonadales bacterium]|nr:hypothetical protein [Gemmatimonadales bacterium]
MSRRSSSWIVVACLTVAALSTACGRSATGPSDPPVSLLETQGSNNETQGSNNLETQGSNN